MRGREFLGRIQAVTGDWRVLDYSTAGLHELASVQLTDEQSLRVTTADGKVWEFPWVDELNGRHHSLDAHWLWLELRDMDEKGRMELAYHTEARTAHQTRREYPRADRIVLVFFNKQVSDPLQVAQEEQHRVGDEAYTRHLCG